MNKFLFVMLLVLATSTVVSRDCRISSLHKKPGYKIKLITIESNEIRGRLLRVNDSAIVIYPGKQKEWRMKRKYSPAIYESSWIRKIRIGNAWFYIDGSQNEFNKLKMILSR